ncbi:LLM class flavin-dependent oxidoreductase [Amycolatopsis jiangsuensis]|uniref:Alkanesulfonate monooxygenase SsuD/methylene tetrahydromethanopterin reductase-like flavin-dependent oxidoreductase (Luciferase family) n=1 Tax=Amycolatopsis jiangsuensis TaxID=1181879 RepID=A0A840J6Z4_9PSEU|nr:LLM class flavin-dependent oxidoreductase [Amycolatopsis jiangsuensis]MBB4689563.1 alkanesulfonate monooxygenase SsuD/methylene tetrahydromethanopterin reductase-like flavin-dependent oxidoreductase (luciferase family) [Amycolatopsis jiangsuensis]
MTDYGHDLTFGSFLTPAASPPQRAVDLAVVSEQAGLDLVSFQDHPYQPSFHDTWTLMTYVAARTERIRISGNVLSLPLRPPAVLARAAASLDRLSDGRVEVGLGAGAFWDGIVAMGARRLSPREAARSVEEAIPVMRGLWAVDEPGGLRFDGTIHEVRGAKRGPAPAHPIPIRVGAYKPRMLGLTGRLANGWLPSLTYLPDGLASLTPMSRRIDEGAAAAGRDPAELDRILNIGGRFTRASEGLFAGPPGQWAEQITDVALVHGISGFVLMSDDPEDLMVFGREVAPLVREKVAAERGE